jgi:uncharacterized protein (TIGR02246 family)
MKLIHLCLAAMVLISVSTSAIAAQASSDESSINEVMARQQQAWNAADSHAWAADYVEDADFVNILGTVLHGRAEIDQRHAVIFAGPYKGSHLNVSVRSFKMLSPSAALVAANLDMTGYRALPPGIEATSEGLLRTHMNYVLVKKESRWWITSAQNTAERPAPPPASHP